MEPNTRTGRRSADMLLPTGWKPEDFPLGRFEDYSPRELDLLFKNASIENLPVIKASDTEETVQSQDPQEIPGEGHAATKSHISKTGKKYYKQKLCPHNRRKFVCKECGGSGICMHMENKYTCKHCKWTKSQEQAGL